MPLFNNFPYTDYHQMNLDYILKQVKQIDELTAQVNEIAGKYTDMYNRVNDMTSLYENWVETAIAEIQRTFEGFGQYFTDEWTSFTAYVEAVLDQQNAMLNNFGLRIDHLENTVAAAYYMDSPFTGERVPMQEVIYQLASMHMTDALTAAEYDAADLTASAYDALALTAYQYDWHGSTYIS